MCPLAHFERRLAVPCTAGAGAYILTTAPICPLAHFERRLAAPCAAGAGTCIYAPSAQQALWLVANAVCERYARAASGRESMRRVGLEPTRVSPQEPKSCLSANSNIGAAKAAAGPYALPQLPTTSIFCITYAFTLSIAGAQYFFGSKSSGCAAICSLTPSVKAIRRSVA